LISRGADVNAVDRHANSGDTGLTVLDIARLNGDTPVVQLLVESGARGSITSPVALKPRSQNNIRSAVQDSLPLLQRADREFTSRSGCISCHNNSLTAMTVGLARKRGLRIDEQTATAQVRANVLALETLRDRLHQGFMLPIKDNFSQDLAAYILIGLNAENYKPDLNTDAAAIHILWRQNADGSWPVQIADSRPPLCLGYIEQTALSMRALQLYAPKAGRGNYDRAVQLAASWLAKARAFTNEDRAWHLAGLAWAGTDTAATRKAMNEVLATQRPDGGWSDLPTTQSTAYATGKILVALQLAGMPVSDLSYERGLKFLISTQQEDGSWYVKTRALAFQPWFDAGFPHGYDQWISAAATSWASMALTFALPETGLTVASRVQ